VPSTSFQLPPEAAAALARGEVVAAVKAVRQATGMSLKDANDLVRAHANRPGGARVDGATSKVEFEFPPAAAAAVARGEFVNAIALLREANPQLNLKTARDAVEHVRRGALPTADQPVENALSDYPARVPTVVAGDRGSRGWLTVMLVVVFAVFLLWILGAP
jgi:ribosomal protein L7/L12